MHNCQERSNVLLEKFDPMSMCWRSKRK